MTDRCSKCPVPVRWVKTVNNKPMLVDQEPCADGNLVLIDTAAGTRAIVVKSQREFVGLPRYRSHFSTCPAAASFRKRKEKRA